MPARDGSTLASREETGDAPAVVPESADRITAHYTTPDRVVFTECDNCDGWIASDLTVDLRR